MERKDCISPMDYRYLPRDEGLQAKLAEYHDLDILAKIQRLVPELLVPRLRSLETTLLNIAKENAGLDLPERIDGRQTGRKIRVEQLFRDYATRLSRRSFELSAAQLDFESMPQSFRNDRLSDIIYLAICALTVEANIANDTRHYWRSEIEEMGPKEWGEDRVGSSTMSHKINPADYENIVGLWQTYIPSLTTAVLCQLVEHQGDSTKECLLDVVFETLGAVCYATAQLEHHLKNLKITPKIPA